MLKVESKEAKLFSFDFSLLTTLDMDNFIVD